MRMCITAGALGVITGMAVFVLLIHDPEKVTMKLAAILGLAATLAFVFDYLRNAIEEREEESLCVSRVLLTLVLLAVCELFITAVHASTEITAVSINRRTD
jgi:hypothetical protein